MIRREQRVRTTREAKALQVRGVIRKTNRCTLDVGFPIENSSHRQKCAGPFGRCRPIVNQATSDFVLLSSPEALSFFLSFLPSFFPPPANRERGNPPRPRVMRFYESQSGLGRPGFPSRSATSRDTNRSSNQRFQFFFFLRLYRFF